MIGGKLLAAALLMLAATPALADATTEQRLRDALRRTAQELQTLQAGQGDTVAKLAAATAERDKAIAALAAERGKSRPKPGADAALARVGGLERELADAKAQLAARDAEIAAARTGAQQQVLASRTDAERKIAAATAAAAEANGRIGQCTAQNDAMFKTASELLTLYRDPKFLSQVRGPASGILGLKRSRIENRVQAYGDTLYAQRYPPAVAKPIAQ